VKKVSTRVGNVGRSLGRKESNDNLGPEGGFIAKGGDGGSFRRGKQREATSSGIAP